MTDRFLAVRSASNAPAGSSARGGLFHPQLCAEAFSITIDGRHREDAAVALVANRAVARRDVAVDREFVPLRRVPDIVDRHVVMLAPEEGHGVERLAPAEHVERRCLALALGDDP